MSLSMDLFWLGHDSLLSLDLNILPCLLLGSFVFDFVFAERALIFMQFILILLPFVRILIVLLILVWHVLVLILFALFMLLCKLLNLAQRLLSVDLLNVLYSLLSFFLQLYQTQSSSFLWFLLLRLWRMLLILTFWWHTIDLYVPIALRDQTKYFIKEFQRIHC